jgi:hypothetical protein
VVSGDGADQAMRHQWDCDLLPLTLTVFRDRGVNLVAPYLDAVPLQPDPGKASIRAIAAELGLPDLPKRPTMFPWTEAADCLDLSMKCLSAIAEARERCAASPA